jgi:hypothetical protein
MLVKWQSGCGDDRGATHLVLGRSVHPALAGVVGAAANGRPFERVADDSRHPRRADPSSSARDRLHEDPARPAPSRVRDLATPIGQRESPEPRVHEERDDRSLEQEYQ